MNPVNRSYRDASRSCAARAAGACSRAASGQANEAPNVVVVHASPEGRKPKADPMAKRTPGIPGPSACHEPFGS
jgi:hypothetical protein